MYDMLSVYCYSFMYLTLLWLVMNVAKNVRIQSIFSIGWMLIDGCKVKPLEILAMFQAV